MKAKGHGQGDCCCGGCRSPIKDGRLSTDEIVPSQQYCCRCIPNQICVSIVETGITSVALLDKYCPNSYTGDPIQYSDTFHVGSGDHTFYFRTIVESGRCYLGWDAATIPASGRTLIDSGVPCTGECPPAPSGLQGNEESPFGASGTINCVCFSGHWHYPPTGTASVEFDLTVTKPSTINLLDLIPCGGCGCICDCLCMSIWYQQSGNLEFIGSNNIACSEIETIYTSGCGQSGFAYNTSIKWVSNGWTITLDGNYGYTPTGYIINSGIDVTGVCHISDVLLKTDGYEHTVNESGSINVIYDFDVETNIPYSFVWVGRSYGLSSSLLFESYNFGSTSWDSLRTVGGRPSGSNINRSFEQTLGSEYVDSGLVRIRLSSIDSSQVISDQLRIIAHECCKLELSPSGGINPNSTISPYVLSGVCPSPKPFWNFLDSESRDWYIYADCNWCGDHCGFIPSECCNRPLPRVLVAEVDLDCANCGGVLFDVALVSSDGTATWNGEEPDVCGTPFTVVLSCVSSGTFSIATEGAGSCSFSQTKAADSCDPLSISYSGLFEGGLGCCGPSATGTITSTAISISVFE